MSDSESSSAASEKGDESDTTKAYRKYSKRRRKKDFNKQYGLDGESRDNDTRPVKAEAEHVSAKIPSDRKGKGRAQLSSTPQCQQVDTSATEDSDNETPLRVKQEQADEPPFQLSRIGRVSANNQAIKDESESDLSEDVSPLGDPGGYLAQLERRAARLEGASVSTILSVSIS